MLTDANYTHGGEWFVMYVTVGSLCGSPEINVNIACQLYFKKTKRKLGRGGGILLLINC